MMSLQRDKAVLNIYSFQKVSVPFFFLMIPVAKVYIESQDQIALKIILPEKLSCIAVDRRGDYCAGGTTHGRIHLWEVCRYWLLSEYS